MFVEATCRKATANNSISPHNTIFRKLNGIQASGLDVKCNVTRSGEGLLVVIVTWNIRRERPAEGKGSTYKIRTSRPTLFSRDFKDDLSVFCYVISLHKSLESFFAVQRLEREN
jgi:hypothetical protein